jgi:hypothetical protein
MEVALMRRTALLIAAVAGAAAIASPAQADPVTGRSSFGTIVCDGVTYVVVSAGTHTLTASALTADGQTSTSQFLLVTDKDPSFPTRLLTTCTAVPPPPDDPFTATFFITPAN